MDQSKKELSQILRKEMSHLMMDNGLLDTDEFWEHQASAVLTQLNMRGWKDIQNTEDNLEHASDEVCDLREEIGSLEERIQDLQADLEEMEQERDSEQDAKDEYYSILLSIEDHVDQLDMSDFEENTMYIVRTALENIQGYLP